MNTLIKIIFLLPLLWTGESLSENKTNTKSGWLIDQNTGCKAYEEDISKKNMEWTGKCKNGMLSGFGVNTQNREGSIGETVFYKGFYNKGLKNGLGTLVITDQPKERGVIAKIYFGNWRDGKLFDGYEADVVAEFYLPGEDRPTFFSDYKDLKSSNIKLLTDRHVFKNINEYSRGNKIGDKNVYEKYCKGDKYKIDLELKERIAKKIHIDPDRIKFKRFQINKRVEYPSGVGERDIYSCKAIIYTSKGICEYPATFDIYENTFLIGKREITRGEYCNNE